MRASHRRSSNVELLTRIKSKLEQTQAANLLSLISHQPEVHEQDKSLKHHLLIVLATADLAHFEKLADALQDDSGQIDVMVLSQDELNASTDVFPVTFLEMRRRYEVLAGQDVLANLRIDRDHLRLRCEQELRNMLLRMQRQFILHRHHNRDLLESLRRSNLVFRRCLRAAVYLSEGEQRDYGDCSPEETSQILNIDLAILDRTSEILHSSGSPAPAVVADVYGQFIVHVHQVTEHVDRMEHETIVDVELFGE